MRWRWLVVHRLCRLFAVMLFAGMIASATCSSTPAWSGGAEAATTSDTGIRTGRKSGLPVPRFVSLKTGRVNVRVGPGENYRIAWVFTKPGLPIEIIQEFDTWRRVRDSDGAVGWILQGLLSGKRTAVVAPWGGGYPRPIRAKATPDANTTAYLAPGVLGEIDRCRGGWCSIVGEGFSGWIEQDQLWGVYPGEEID
jgi:SH3-like domain-containing protein